MPFASAMKGTRKVMGNVAPRLGWLLLVLSVVRGAAEGIPEPYLTLYGTVSNVTTAGSARYTSGTLVWQFYPLDGSTNLVTVSNTLANLNDQFSYVIRVPCESLVSNGTPSANTLRLLNPPLVYDRSQIRIDNRPARLVLPELSNLTFSPSERGRVQRVDLLLLYDAPDSDGNGLPDEWEARFFGRLGVNPNADTDGDGMSNRSEYLAGTDPNDAQSAFRIIQVARGFPTGVLVTWLSQPGKHYSLLRSSSLLIPSTAYSKVATNIAGTSPRNLFRDATATGTGPYFYRLFVEP